MSFGRIKTVTITGRSVESYGRTKERMREESGELVTWEDFLGKSNSEIEQWSCTWPCGVHGHIHTFGKEMSREKAANN